MSTESRGCRVVFIGLLWLIALAGTSAGETFPGANGDILFFKIVGTRQLFLVRPDGSDVRDLSNNGNEDHSGSFTADGTRVAFVRIESFSPLNTDIHVMNADGSGQINVTHTVDITETSPSWSPDGTRIAFASNRAAPGTNETDIYVMGGAGAIVRLTTGGNNFDPEWSPDGQRIAFTSMRDGIQEIYVMDDQGRGQTNLTMDSGFVDFGANWSPDGTQIAFVSDRDGILDVFVMNEDGTMQTNLSMSPGTRDLAPVFSPDGRKIAFSKAPPPLGTTAEIYVMNADGTESIRLTSTSEGESVTGWQPLTTDGAIGRLIGDIQDLVDGGSLNKGQGNALTVKLDHTLSQIAKDKVQQAINLLQSFINQVSALITAGVLTSEEGEPLIDAAVSIMTYLVG